MARWAHGTSQGCCLKTFQDGFPSLLFYCLLFCSVVIVVVVMVVVVFLLEKSSILALDFDNLKCISYPSYP